MADNVDPRIVLLPQPRSHQFVARDVILRDPAMVGRSVARTRITQSNLIFDCRVLSRSHAVVWYDNGKFFIKDTKSSNGTFVNDRRLSRSGEESAQYELKSGDIVQFGVNVEGPSRVTHGCIIGSIQLYIGNKELPSRDESPQDHLRQSLQVDGVSEKDIEDALKTVQAAYRSEMELEMKLSQLQRIVMNAKAMAAENMMAIVKEDQLLSRLEMMENQLRLYTQDHSEEDMRSKLRATLEEKHRCEEVAKDQIHLLLSEKATNVAELAVVKQQLEDAKSEIHRLTSRLEELRREHDEEQMKIMDQLKIRNEQYKQLEEAFTTEKAMGTQREEVLRKALHTTRLELDSVKEKLEDAQKELRIVKLEKDSLQQRLNDIEIKPNSSSRDFVLEGPLTAQHFASLFCEAVILKGQMTLMNDTIEERSRQLKEMQDGIRETNVASVFAEPSVLSTLTPPAPDIIVKVATLEKECTKLQETIRKLTVKNRANTTQLAADQKKMANIMEEKNELAATNQELREQLAGVTAKYDVLKKTGSPDANTDKNKDTPNPLASAIFCFSVGIAIASFFYYYIHNRG
jgi:regulator of replication initiation timing